MLDGERNLRKQPSAGLCAAAGLASWVFLAAEVSAQTEQMDGYDLQDFSLGTAAHLIDVCTLEESDPDHVTAMAFCYGFFEGGYHYDVALTASPDHARIVCEPEGTTRTQAVDVSVTYIKANPQYAGEMPIDAIFRALVDKWPCT